jgi:hypothetical protein
VKKAPQLATNDVQKYDIWHQSLTVATVVTVEQLSRVEKYGLSYGQKLRTIFLSKKKKSFNISIFKKQN